MIIYDDMIIFQIDLMDMQINFGLQ